MIVQEYDSKGQVVNTRCDIDITEDDRVVGQITYFIDSSTEEKLTYLASMVIFKGYSIMSIGTEVIKQLASLHNGVYLCPDNEDSERLCRRLGEELDSRHIPPAFQSSYDEYGKMYFVEG